MTNPSKMITPKEALKKALAWMPIEDAQDDELYEELLAAIPIAELEAEAMKLLIRFGIFVGIQHSSPEYVEWRNERESLLTQWEALK